MGVPPGPRRAGRWEAGPGAHRGPEAGTEVHLVVELVAGWRRSGPGAGGFVPRRSFSGTPAGLGGAGGEPGRTGCGLGGRRQLGRAL